MLSKYKRYYTEKQANGKHLARYDTDGRKANVGINIQEI